jgi:hypothetical protein
LGLGFEVLGWSRALPVRQSKTQNPESKIGLPARMAFPGCPSGLPSGRRPDSAAWSGMG